MVRSGTRHETYWNYSFSPIREADGRIVGILNQGHEVTDRVLGERRDRFLLGLSDRLRRSSDARAIIEAAQEALGNYLNANRVGSARSTIRPDISPPNAIGPTDACHRGRARMIWQASVQRC